MSDADGPSSGSPAGDDGSDARPMHTGPVLDKPDPVLVVDGMRKAFGGLVATDDVSFEVERGSITGLIGPNGAGKSTLFNLVSGFYEPDAGSVTIRPQTGGTGGDVDTERLDSDVDTEDPDVDLDAGNPGDVVTHDLTGLEPNERAQKGLVRSFQTPRKPEGMTVREAMLTGPKNQTGESIVPLFTSPETVRKEESRSLRRVDEMLERFEIGHLAASLATDLSGGQMKLVELARAMMTDPELLLLDEPVAGVNPTLANKLRTFIEELNAEGTTFCIIEHDMSFIMRLADPIIVLNQGRVLGEGSPEAVRTDERVIDAYLGGPA